MNHYARVAKAIMIIEDTMTVEKATTITFIELRIIKATGLGSRFVKNYLNLLEAQGKVKIKDNIVNKVVESI